MNKKLVLKLTLPVLFGLFFSSGLSSAAGQVYLVLGSDTAIWQGMNVGQYHCYYDIDLYTNPSRNTYQVMDPAFRAQFVDSYGQPLKMTWWMMAGNIFRYATNENMPVPNIMTMYLMKKYHGDNVQINGDELSLHYHTFAWTDYNSDGLYYWNQSQTFMECFDDWNYTLAQFLLEEQVFPVSFRSGWHYMDNGWQAVLDNLLPYSMHNASPGVHSDTTEPTDNNYDWSQATLEFVPYHPSPENYQLPGDGPGWNVRCRYFGTVINYNTLKDIFAQANAGIDQLTCIWSHLPEVPFLTDIAKIDSLAQEAAALYPDVNFRYCTAIEAMQRWRGTADTLAPTLALWEIPSGDVVSFGISTDEPIFQSVPFVAAKTIYEEYLLIPCQSTGANQWETTESFSRDQLAKVGVVVCDTLGNQAMEFIQFLPDDIFVDNVDTGYVEIQKSWSISPECSWGLDSRVTTLALGDTAIARWYPEIEDSAFFNIFVQIPEISNSAEQITYKVFNQGVCIDTVQFASVLPTMDWVYLSTSYLTPGAEVYLQVQASGDGQEGQILCADVARFSAAVRAKDLHVVDQVLDFGAVPQEDSVSLDLRLENLGYENLTVSDITSLHSDITIPVVFPVMIPGMGSVDIPVQLQPQEIGAMSDEMYVHSDDPTEPMVPVLVTADVQPYFVVVDNEDSLDYVEEGTWHTSVAQAYGASSRYAYLNQVPGASARFSATLNKSGIYRIFQIVPNTSNATDHAVYVLSISDVVVDSVVINQNEGSGSWVPVGHHHILADQEIEVKVLDTGESTYGDVLRADAIKVAITLTPEAVDDLRLMVVGGAKSSSGDLYLSWGVPDAYEGVDHYIIYRSVGADDIGDSLAITMATSYTDSNVVGNESVQFFYVVKCIDVVGNKSEASNRVGEFDKGLVSVK